MYLCNNLHITGTDLGHFMVWCVTASDMDFVNRRLEHTNKINGTSQRPPFYRASNKTKYYSAVEFETVILNWWWLVRHCSFAVDHPDAFWCLVIQLLPNLSSIMQCLFSCCSRRKPSKPAVSLPNASPSVSKLNANSLFVRSFIFSETV